MRLTAKYFKSTLPGLSEVMELPEDYLLTLESYNPGDYPRYQLSIRKKDGYDVLWTMPRNYHMKTRDFKMYLEGMMDILWELPKIKKLM